MKRLRISAALALGSLLALSGMGGSAAFAAPPASASVSVSAAFHVYPISEDDNLIMGKDAPKSQVKVKLPGTNGAAKNVTVNGGGYWFYPIPKGTVLKPGQQVTITDSKQHETSVKIGKKTEVNQPVEGQDAVTGTGEPGTFLRVALQDKENGDSVVGTIVKVIVGDDGTWSALIGRGLEIGETVIVSQSYKVDIAKDVKAKESQNVTVSVVYNQLRADGGFEQIPGTGRTAVLSQPALDSNGSNLKVDLSGFEKVTVKGLPWKLTEVKFPAGITAVDGSSRMGEVDRHLEGELVINLIYEKEYASGKPLTQPEKPVLDPSELRQKVNVFVEYDVLRADGGFEQIPGTGRTAVLSQPSLSADGSNLKVDLSGFEKVTVKGLPWKLTEVKFPAGITAVDGSSHVGEVDRHLEGDVVVHLLYEKAYASGKPLTQPEKPVLDPSELRQKVNVFVEYDVLRADGGFEQIPGTGRTAVLSQPSLSADGSNLKVDLSGFEKVTVKGLPWKLTEVKFPAGITAVDGSSHVGEVDRHLEGDVVVHLLYEKAYASGKPLTQPEKPEVTEISGTPLIQPEKPKGEIGISGDPLIQPEKPKGEISVPGDPLVQPEKPVLDPDMVKTAKAPELSKTGAAVEGVLAGSLALIILGGAALTARRRMN
ncbi:hypothetical protein RQN30_00700 [Arcanobacterium hippocoleae]